jgi:hypothetical protein
MPARSLHESGVAAADVLEIVARHLAKRLRGPDERPVREVQVDNDARSRVVWKTGGDVNKQFRLSARHEAWTHRWGLG